MDYETYETIDWNAEAKRIAWAFGIAEECWFEKVFSTWHLQSHYSKQEKWNKILVPINPSLDLECRYTLYRDGSRYFAIVEGGEDYTGISLRWNGDIGGRSQYLKHAPELARALFHLELLTPAVEAVLYVSISAHQKLEWELEYAKRYDL